ncbi:MAG TPA: lytic transglycosylase domain-containing protein [Beijerinckiaceae bacterium]|nr:lytic transglycosylase domain-containing protein [Beijerinckiaceae bacterium]
MRDAVRALVSAGAMSLSALVPQQIAGVSPLPGLTSTKVVDAASSPVETSIAPAASASPAGRAHRQGPPIRLVRRETTNGLAAIAAATPRSGTPSPVTPPLVVAYAPSADAAPVQNPLLAPVPPVDTGIAGLREAIAAYHAGNLAQGDAAAGTVEDPIARTAIEWLAERVIGRLPLERVDAFLTAHPDWPAADYLRRRAEVALYADHRSPAVIEQYFAGRAPETIFGKLALARAKLAAGPDGAPEATRLVREVWLSGDIGLPVESAVLREFRDFLTKADNKLRSDKLFYHGLDAAARRAAVLAGPDQDALSKARDNPQDQKLADALPASVHNDPTLLFAKVRALRERSKFSDAAKDVLAAPRDVAEPDQWWGERKLLARKLLDAGDAKTAYRLCAEAAPNSDDKKFDAAFEAGWIALRFLHDPAAAAPHFAAMTKVASAPSGVARAAYWQGRTADAAGRTDEAKDFYRAAALHATTYYGQLARAKLGETDIPMPSPHMIAQGDQRAEVVRVVELLETLGETAIALPLAIDAARHLDDEAQIAALAEVLSKAGDARATLLVGKAATTRGFALDAWAFPTFGVPAFDPIGKSAATPIVYAIARQESAFATDAVSSAGAIGLMQMIVSTARRTATQIGVPFDQAKLMKDATFNAQLGAAHLGELMHENGGSMALTFAAYNAGGRRVKQWIDAYGDPRKPDVDPVDWVERIPIDETRNYVQRVIESLQTYRGRFGDSAPLRIDSDLR